MADTYKKSSTSIFNSPRFFTGIASKGYTDTESIMSPTSVLDSKPFSTIKTPFCSNSNSNSPRISKPQSRTKWDKLDSKGVGLGLIDALVDETTDTSLSKIESRVVLFGSQLKIQVPNLPKSVVSPNSDYPPSPRDFGIKTRTSQLGSLSPLSSPYSSNKSPFSYLNSGLESSTLPHILSAGEMELSEDYTCVITHGLNPKTTHIFDDCIIENCCGIVGFSASSKKENGPDTEKSLRYPSESFLSFCYNCNKNIGQGKDIYMYRGEKAFCSSECRYKEIISDEGSEQGDDLYGT
ncbi:FCS-Like Zinc finger 8-like [Apium graveolens]|uniref:FCS-Like Zinc finger 8-like n=1 Tax=Apium graveolens TaxID=4045 RepID=UPI003D7BA5B6